MLRSLTLDAQKTVYGKFKPSTRAEREFYQALKKVAHASGHIVDQHVRLERGFGVVPFQLVGPADLQAMQDELDRYARKLEPWARRQAVRMLEQVQNSNKRAYASKSKAIAVALQKGFAEQEVGAVALKLLNEQVGLIQSIPREAGLRAQRIAFEAALEGTRAGPNTVTIRQLKDELDMSTEVATTRALLISRTETARATAAINQSRAMAVGSQQYRWHNSGDEAVRESHRFYKGRRLQGRIFSWDDPPTLDDGMTGHPGTFPNCRCFAEPVFEDQ